MTSLMHLPRKAFTKNGFNTLDARAGDHVVLGSSAGLSEIDKAQLNRLYSCTGYPSESHVRLSLKKFILLTPLARRPGGLMLGAVEIIF